MVAALMVRRSHFHDPIYFVERIASLLVGFVLLTAGGSHFANPYHFLARLMAYDLFDSRAALAIALSLPSLELVLGFCLLWHTMPLSAHLTTACVLCAFLAAQITAMARGLHIDCGCFGPSAAEPISAWTIARTALLAATVILASVCELFRSKRVPAGSATLANTDRGVPRSEPHSL